MHNEIKEDLQQDADRNDKTLLPSKERNGTVKTISKHECTLNGTQQLEFKIDEYPPWHITLFYSFQYLTTVITGPLTASYLIHMNICTEGRDANLLFAQLLSTAMVMTGISTFLQTTFGVRLPMVQGSASYFIVCLTAMMESDAWKCPEIISNLNNNTQNITNEKDEPWIPILNEINGCLLLASVVEVLIGLTGVVGLLLKFISPLTIGIMVSVVGLSLADAISVGIGQHWGIAMMEAVLLVIFSMLLDKYKVPIPTVDMEKGCKLMPIRLFKIFPFLFATSITWLFCFILTVTNVLPTDPTGRGYQARTDAKPDVIARANWFYFPYPGQWGMPTITAPGVVIGMLSLTISSSMESIGTYHTAAKACQVATPPKHAMNRGVMMEGLASILSALCGAAHPTTGYTSNVGFITLTGVASRIVIQVFAILMFLLGIFGKFGAALVCIPSPIIGGSAVVCLGMVIGVGLSMLQFVDLNSGRNLFIIGVSHLMGLMVPSWLSKNPDAINTGIVALDQTFTVFLSMSILIGGLTAFTLDNIIPGTKKERGLHIYEQRSLENDDNYSNDAKGETDEKSVYDLPLIGAFIKRFKVFSYIPCMPTYKDRRFRCCRTRKVESINETMTLSCNNV